jgi:hypothetical protein
VPLTVYSTTFVQSPSITSPSLNHLIPEVLLFSCSAGYSVPNTSAVQSAIASFLAGGGKRIVATYVSFFQQNVADNRWLLPYFGLDPNLNLVWTSHEGQAFTFANTPHPLGQGLPTVVPVSGHVESQLPSDLSWDQGDYLGELVATSLNGRNIVHVYIGPTYEAIFVSFMPEFGGDSLARQLMYNCITAPIDALPTLVPLASPSIGSVLPLSVQATAHPNAGFIVGFAASTTPGIVLSDNRVIPLTVDPLLLLSLTPNNGIFLHTTGFLDGSGVAAAWATVSIPALPTLVGQTFYGAMITLDSGSTTGVGGISAPLPIMIVN